MMEATDQGQFNHLATLWRFYPPRHGTIMLEDRWGAYAVILIQIALQKLP